MLGVMLGIASISAAILLFFQESLRPADDAAYGRREFATFFAFVLIINASYFFTDVALSDLGAFASESANSGQALPGWVGLIVGSPVFKAYVVAATTVTFLAGIALGSLFFRITFDNLRQLRGAAATPE